jgi:hypothetical protein
MKFAAVSVAVTAALGSCAGVALAAPAQPAAPAARAHAAVPVSAAVPADSLITATYPAAGSTYLNAPGSTVTLGPGTLSSTVDLSTSAVAATLTLPPATVSFKEFGLIPVSATAEFIQDGPATGTASLSDNTVTATLPVTFKITSLNIAGLPIPVGSQCQTTAPAAITVSSQPGFNLLSGGTLAGTYTIPPFTHCGLKTLLINHTVPGPGNTITLTLGQATLS